MKVDNEQVYLNLLRNVLLNGELRNDRTGTGTLSVFGAHMRFDISDSFPLLTTKFVPWKAVIKELLWFLKGQTDATILSQQGVKIWDGNTTREFLDRRGLKNLPEGDIGAGYGFQWRHFGGRYVNCTVPPPDEERGFDQIKYIIEELRNNPTSRRIFMSAWNPLQMHAMALPPCHVSAQFYVCKNGKLSCHMYQRSVDCFLGLPFNIASYSALTYIFASLTGLSPGELIISTGDTHIYSNHIEQVKLQLSRDPKSTVPKLILSPSIKNKNIDELILDDFSVVDYEYHPTIKADMSV